MEIPSCKCERCGYTWYLRYPQKPRVCPRCKSPYWQANSDFINDLNIDSQKAQEVIAELTSRINEATKKESAWAPIVREGWKRMFETSELPISSVDRLLAGGFSIHDWFMNANKISLGLAESVVGRFVLAAEPPVAITEGVVRKAEDTLRWRRVLEMLDQDTARVLGLLWFADKLMADILYPETEVLVQKSVWQLLEKSLDKRKDELISNVECTIEMIDEKNKGVTSWADVIRFT